jgi:quercetin dioxygenase-like cupin family protein
VDQGSSAGDRLSETEVEFPLSGERFAFTSDPGDRECFAFDFRVAPGGGVFFEHRHMGQREVMRGISGALEVVADGEPLRLGAGDELVLEPGTLHTLTNTADVEARCEVEYRPAGRNREWFQLIAAHQHRTGRDPGLFDLAPFIDDVDIQARGPVRLQRLAFRYLLGPLATLLGRRRRMLAIASEAYGRPFTW